MELNSQQFGGQNTHDPTGSSYSPKHSNWSMSGSTGSHAKPGKSGRAKDSGFYTAQHTKNDSGYVGRHASDRRARLGVIGKAARKLVGR